LDGPIPEADVFFTFIADLVCGMHTGMRVPEGSSAGLKTIELQSPRKDAFTLFLG
jgi:hypothetical protein